MGFLLLNRGRTILIRIRHVDSVETKACENVRLVRVTHLNSQRSNAFSSALTPTTHTLFSLENNNLHLKYINNFK